MANACNSISIQIEKSYVHIMSNPHSFYINSLATAFILYNNACFYIHWVKRILMEISDLVHAAHSSIPPSVHQPTHMVHIIIITFPFHDVILVFRYAWFSSSPFNKPLTPAAVLPFDIRNTHKMTNTPTKQVRNLVNSAVDGVQFESRGIIQSSSVNWVGLPYTVNELFSSHWIIFLPTAVTLSSGFKEVEDELHLSL